MGDLLHQLHELNRVTASVADNSKQQFADVWAQSQNVQKTKFEQFNKVQRLYLLCADILPLAGNDKMQDLWTVVKNGSLVLSLSLSLYYIYIYIYIYIPECAELPHQVERWV